MDESGWRGRGRGRGSPGGQWHSPRYRGNKGFSPRYTSPHSPGGGGGGWDQNTPYQFQPPFQTSTPIHHHQRPQFRGGGRPNYRNFNSPRHFTPNRSEEGGGIEKWVSPLMWEDPWKDFSDEGKGHSQTERVLSTTKFAPLDSDAESFTNSSLQNDDIAESTQESSAAQKTDDGMNVNTPEDILKLITS